MENWIWGGCVKGGERLVSQNMPTSFVHVDLRGYEE